MVACERDLEAPISTARGGARRPEAGRRAMRHYGVLVAVSGFVVVAFACFAYTRSAQPAVLKSATEKALKLELSKRKYSAKERVAKLHTEFDALKKQLKDQ